jgi:purine-nucleoside phosphorylase
MTFSVQKWNPSVCLQMHVIWAKKAACILTISDSIVNKTETTPEQRQTGFIDMMEIALDAAIKM